MNFVVPVPANIADLEFSWQSLAGHPAYRWENIEIDIQMDKSNWSRYPRDLQAYTYLDVSIRVTGSQPQLHVQYRSSIRSSVFTKTSRRAREFMFSSLRNV
ncbi:Tyrosine-protein kinase Drl [Vespula squamosa]|uniref:Tyrosine-protein kinase Drl n=1 Tax=Vespula squamosa TaxID=30214 RepID=A0ABD2AQJ7_VESSQ